MNKLFFLLLGLFSASAIASFVSPLQVDLNDTRRGFLTVSNDGQDTALYELTILEWGGDGNPKQLADPDSLMVMPSIVSLGPGEDQRFTIVSSMSQAEHVRSFRLIIKETKMNDREGSLNLSVTYNLPVYDWPHYDTSPFGDVYCSEEDGTHLLTNDSKYPIRVSRAYEGIVPLTNVILPGQILRTTQADIHSLDCKGLYEFIEPDAPQ